MTTSVVDSHCHLDFPDLLPRIDEIRDAMSAASVSHALCVAVDLENLPRVIALAEQYENFFASVGVHPDHDDGVDPTAETLLSLASHPKVVAIGETGLDYFRHPERAEVQRARFANHIAAAREARKPLIVHTRSASDDTIGMLRSERASDAGGVMHCFTETWDVARAALDLGFHISLSGIVTFKSAESLREVARQVPADRLLVETDSPYLAPVPHRGRTNEPAFVRHVCDFLADLRQVDRDTLAATTTDNFFRLFRDARR